MTLKNTHTNTCRTEIVDVPKTDPRISPQTEMNILLPLFHKIHSDLIRPNGTLLGEHQQVLQRPSLTEDGLVKRRN